MKSKQHIYLVDDDKSMLEVLVRLFMQEGYQLHVFSDSVSFVESGPLVHPCAIILDMQMPRRNGLDIQADLTRAGNTAPIVFLSGQSYPPQIVSGIKNGAFDFLFKPVELELLIQTVERAIAFDQVHQASVSDAAEMVARYEALTPREQDVCVCLAQGMINKNIAMQLGISGATVKIHKYRVLEKMAVATQSELVKICLLLKLVTDQGIDRRKTPAVIPLS